MVNYLGSASAGGGNEMQRNKYTINRVKLDELSLVDEPANQHAIAVLLKNKKARRNADGSFQKSDEGAEIMDIEELQARLAEAEAEVQKQRERADLAEANVGAFEAAIDKDAFEVTKSAEGKVEIAKRKVEDTIEIDGEHIAKSLIPAPVLKRLEAAQNEADELRKAKEMEDLRKSAEEAFPNLAGTAEQKTALMKSLNALDENDRDAVMKSLKAADEAMKKMCAEVGDSSGAGGSGTATEELDQMAKKYASENGVTFSEAFSEVTKSGKGRELFVKSRSE